jgi:choline dehydrogenase-like flavoprotein
LARDPSGVEYIPGYNPNQTVIAPNATTNRVLARREIIMAAGALHTPKILQLSGTGSSSVLDRLGINQIINLPGVEENFQDHLAQYLAVVVTNISDPTQNPAYLDKNRTYDAEMGDLYEKTRTGPWTVSPDNTFAFLTADYLNVSYGSFVEAAQQPAAKYLRPGIDSAIINGFERMEMATLRSMMQGTVALTENLFGGVASLRKPLSRGSVHAASTDPYKMPLVEYRTFSNPLDLQIMIQSVRSNRDILPQTAAFKEIGAFVQTPETTLSDIQLGGVIRASADPSFSHPSGTCAMLKLEDGGCVDKRLRLYGSYGRVRVVDASTSLLS